MMFAAVSCNIEPISESGSSTALGLQIEPRCADLSTRSMPEADDTYGERTISGFYYFLYSDAEGTDFLLKGYSSDPSVVVYLDALFNQMPSASGYVFVIANPTDDLISSIDAIAEPTKAQLEALSVDVEFCTPDPRSGRREGFRLWNARGTDRKLSPLQGYTGFSERGGAA